MNEMTPIDVDAVVKAVLAELKRRAPVAEAPEPEVFGGRLLSVDRIAALPPDLKEIRIVPGTVVTPLALDGLKRRGITLKYISRSSASARRAVDPGEWAFGIEGKAGGQTPALRRALLDGWSEIAAIELPRWIVASTGRGALLLASESAVAVWKANRVEGVRAASAVEPDAVARAVRSLGLNLLVIEPSGLSIPLVKSMAETFRRGGSPTAPEALR